MMSPATHARPPVDARRRALVLAVRPEVDGGAFPVKRVIGDRLEVEADIIGDGHDLLRAVLLDRAPGQAAWRETELAPAGNDAWRASIELPALGLHAYAVVAWVDTFGTWRRGLEKKLAAGVEVSLELEEGALLVDAARARADDPVLAQASRALRERGTDVALSDELAAAMRNAAERGHVDRSTERFVLVERRLAACSAWYEMFPRSTGSGGAHGTFRDAERRLGYIAELGFDIVYLPPIHPIGRAFRKGPDNAPTAGPDDPGSPWAIGGPEGGHTAVHPQLGTLADFDRFLAAARSKRLEVALDIAFQASPDHPWVTEHPTWFKQRPDGSIQYAENPPKKYQDVYPFDFDSADWEALWSALKDVFVFWCERGVRVFRVDNPHTKPIRFWAWCLAEVRGAYPDTVFLAEAFTRPKLMYALAKAGFSQGYTYFTWRTSKHELSQYATEVCRTDVAEYFRPSFWPTTPDIFPEHLVHGGRPAFVMRAVLAATLGASYGIYGPSYELCEREPRPGVEELARNEKYELRQWDLEQPGSLRHLLARLNQIRRAHPALQHNRSLVFHPTDNDLVMCYSKRAGDDAVLVVVNLDPHHVHRAWIALDLPALGLASDETFQVHDLLGDARYGWRGARNFVEIAPEAAPAHVFEIRRFARTENQFEYYL
ncbi:MAG: alpha-1,4-glucan--maltose-1-phosphate maltosyltransferase [Myxococcales bacterium]|nr:alpha-1,4-glucan--maltose-1-phosphate maltosyltransferase [Myxococcales bacterium]